MKFLKFYLKPITVGLHLIILSLAIVGICFAFKFDLFTCSEKALNTFEIYTMNDLSFTYQGLLGFSNTMIEFANKNTIFDSFMNIKEVLTEVKVIKVLVYALLVSHALLAIFQLFAYRTKTTLVTCIVTTLLLIALRTVAIYAFKDVGLFETVTKYYNVIMILWLIATFVSGIQVTLYDYISKAKVK